MVQKNGVHEYGGDIIDMVVAHWSLEQQASHCSMNGYLVIIGFKKF